MEKTPTSKIRKIIIGQDTKSGMAYDLGRKFNTPNGLLEVVLIEEDQGSYYFFGNVRYNIWVQTEDTKIVKIWKYFERMPVTIEYEI